MLGICDSSNRSQTPACLDPMPAVPAVSHGLVFASQARFSIFILFLATFLQSAAAEGSFASGLLRHLVAGFLVCEGWLEKLDWAKR